MESVGLGISSHGLRPQAQRSALSPGADNGTIERHGTGNPVGWASLVQ